MIPRAIWASAAQRFSKLLEQKELFEERHPDVTFQISPVTIYRMFKILEAVRIKHYAPLEQDIGYRATDHIIRMYVDQGVVYSKYPESVLQQDNFYSVLEAIELFNHQFALAKLQTKYRHYQEILTIGDGNDPQNPLD